MFWRFGRTLNRRSEQAEETNLVQQGAQFPADSTRSAEAPSPPPPPIAPFPDGQAAPSPEFPPAHDPLSQPAAPGDNNGPSLSVDRSPSVLPSRQPPDDLMQGVRSTQGPNSTAQFREGIQNFFNPRRTAIVSNASAVPIDKPDTSISTDSGVDTPSYSNRASSVSVSSISTLKDAVGSDTFQERRQQQTTSHRSSVGLLNNASSARSSTTVQVDTKTHEDSSNTAPRKLLEAAEVRDLKRKSITVQDPLGSIELLKSHVAEQIVATRATHESVWLDSLNMPLANLRTFDQCVHLFSRNGLCPFELVVADIGEVPKPDEVPPDGFTRSDPLINGKSQWWNLETELKVFQGNCIVKTLTLPTPPTCLLSIRDGSSPAPQKPPPNASLSPPILALASGPHIYLYRDWEPLTKFTLPPVEPSSQEAEIWSQLLAPEAERAAQVAASEGPLEQGAGMNRELVAVALSELKALRETGNVELTIRSLRLMSLEGLRNNALFEGADFPTDAQVDFARAMAEKKLRIEPVITCGTTLDRVVGESKMDCLVFGSEEKRVYVISPPNYSIIEQFQLSSPVAFVGASGSYDTRFTIIAACRDGSLYSLEADKCNRLVQLGAPPCGMVVFSSHIVVGCINAKIESFNHQGSLLFSIKLPARISVMSPVLQQWSNCHGFLVGLHNKEIHIYRSSELINILSIPEVAVSVKFGPFGLESEALVIILVTGAMVVKILRRHVDLSTPVVPHAVRLPHSNISLPVPRRTRLFLDIAKREQEQPYAIFNKFESDFERLKGRITKSFQEVTEKSLDPTALSPSTALSVDIRLDGVGPTFVLSARLRNNSEAFVHNLTILILSGGGYRLDKPTMHVPIISPGESSVRKTFIRRAIEKGDIYWNGPIRLLVVHSDVNSESDRLCRLLFSTNVTPPK